MLDRLNSEEVETVRKALNASAHGPFFPDREFQTLFGVDRSDVLSALERFPNLHGEKDQLAVNNAFANLLSYPHGESLAKYALTSDQLRSTFNKWRAS